VLHESLRIYPPGSLGFPRISPGCQIDGIFVPKGTEVYTSAFTVTHDEKYFKDPESFVPERWLDGEEGEIRKDVKEASQPFSLGYRACIGRRYVRSKKCLFKSNMVNSLTCVVFSFAFMQMASIMAKLLFVYDLELVNKDLDFEAESHCHIMWWKAPVWVRLTKREGVGLVKEL
jgi:cytochrome P450